MYTMPTEQWHGTLMMNISSLLLTQWPVLWVNPILTYQAKLHDALRYVYTISEECSSMN